MSPNEERWRESGDPLGALSLDVASGRGAGWQA